MGSEQALSRGQRINADEQIERLADRARLEPLAIASQPRRDWKNGPEREEHLMLLRKR